jgi:hypothetical protein
MFRYVGQGVYKEVLCDINCAFVGCNKKKPDVFSDSSDMCFRRGSLPGGVVPKPLYRSEILVLMC